MSLDFFASQTRQSNEAENGPAAGCPPMQDEAHCDGPGRERQGISTSLNRVEMHHESGA
jgi:hypothetical protein